MPRAYHPVFRDVSEEITDAQKDGYKAAGWRLSPLPEDVQREVPAEAPSPKKKPAKG